MASARAGSLIPSTFSSATSISLLSPTIRAGTTFIFGESAVASDPSAFVGGSSTCTRWALATTCALVMM